MPRSSALTRAFGAAASVLLAGTGALAIGAPAQAGGGVVTTGESLQVTREDVVLQWEGGRQRMLLQIEAVTEAAEAAIVLPTPSPATVGSGDPRVFEALERAASPRERTVSVWWPHEGGADEQGAEEDVDVLQQVDLGAVEVASLGASDAGALVDWLEESGYQVGAGLEEQLIPYAREGWSYVAVRLTGEGGLTGSIPPIEVSFASDSFVFPMRLSAATSAPAQVRTYVLGDRRVDRADTQREGSQVRFAGTVSASQEPALDSWLEPYGGAGYLTVSEQRFTDPRSQVLADFSFMSSSAPDVSEVRTISVERRLLGLHAGPVLVGLAALLLAAGGVGARGLMRRRSRRPRAVIAA